MAKSSEVNRIPDSGTLEDNLNRRVAEYETSQMAQKEALFNYDILDARLVPAMKLSKKEVEQIVDEHNKGEEIWMKKISDFNVLFHEAGTGFEQSIDTAVDPEKYRLACLVNTKAVLAHEFGIEDLSTI